MPAAANVILMGSARPRIPKYTSLLSLILLYKLTPVTKSNEEYGTEGKSVDKGNSLTAGVYIPARRQRDAAVPQGTERSKRENKGWREGGRERSKHAVVRVAGQVGAADGG